MVTESHFSQLPRAVRTILDSAKRARMMGRLGRCSLSVVEEVWKMPLSTTAVALGCGSSFAKGRHIQTRLHRSRAWVPAATLELL